MTDNRWNSDSFDLAAYLDRLGLPQRRPARAALDELYLAHLQTFTFDNIDVLLGQHPGVDLAAVQHKFVGRGRGGYCFEHATLFAAALEQSGYSVIRRLGRVGDPNEGARAHMVVEVDLEGQRLLADPGFGFSLLRPIALRHGVCDTQGGNTFRVLRGKEQHGPTWELQRLREGRWERMHNTDEGPVLPVDVVMGHHYTSTYPDSPFQNMLTVARFRSDGSHVTLTHDAVTVRRPDTATVHRALQAGELDTWLQELDVALTSAEHELLTDRVTAMTTRTSSGGRSERLPRGTRASSGQGGDRAELASVGNFGAPSARGERGDVAGHE